MGIKRSESQDPQSDVSDILPTAQDQAMSALNKTSRNDQVQWRLVRWICGALSAMPLGVFSSIKALFALSMGFNR